MGIAIYYENENACVTNNFASIDLHTGLSHLVRSIIFENFEPERSPNKLINNYLVGFKKKIFI